ncbi:FAD-dependent oxidoreductase [Desulfitobacterium sp. AusDCA]|uniref:FAD-dependent oxidoreductase n=1 Tax=Desulfitobacterium sp. AusDCA TaxID=3240383 RepID=UPI003DA7A0AF
MYNYKTDVLVIGGGAAGAMAAYEASKYGVKVAMVLKGKPQHSGNTVMAPGAIAGVGSWKLPEDSRDIHFKDTVEGGAYMNEQRLVRILVEESPDLILELERIGALWQREANETDYSLRIDGGHSYARCPFQEDRTGREMLRSLFGELKKRNINIIPEVMVLEVIKEGEKVAGVIGLDLKTCEPVIIKAKAIIMACGGGGNIYQTTDNPVGATGDGYALALKAGAALMDMEFVQFFPLGFTYPDSLRGILGALLYYVHLRNSKGERFMEKYDPERLELSTRDRVARAILTEVREGRGGSHGGIFADMTYHEPGFIAKMQPALYETYLKIGVDPEKDYLEVAPTCHFFMGGIRVNENWQSSVNGLYAAGESGAGIQGGNRLSQNALAELLVSGCRAGKSAAKFALENSYGQLNPHEIRTVEELVKGLFENKEGVRPIHLRRKLQKIMTGSVGVFRTEESLIKAFEELKNLEAELGNQTLVQRSRHNNQELVEGLENYFICTTARCIIEAALLRTESRGAHYRDDYPQRDNKSWLQHLVITERDGKLKVEKVPVDLSEIQPEE